MPGLRLSSSPRLQCRQTWNGSSSMTAPAPFACMIRPQRVEDVLRPREHVVVVPAPVGLDERELHEAQALVGHPARLPHRLKGVPGDVPLVLVLALVRKVDVAARLAHDLVEAVHPLSATALAPPVRRDEELKSLYQFSFIHLSTSSTFIRAPRDLPLGMMKSRRPASCSW